MSTDSTPQELAAKRLELAAVTLLRKRMNARYDELRAELGADMTPGEHQPANLLDSDGQPTGVTVGKLTMTNPEPKAVVGSPCHVCGTVYDAPAFVRYVEERWPKQVVKVVRPAHQKFLLGDPTLRRIDDVTVVTADGELLPDARWMRERPGIRVAPQTERQAEYLIEAFDRGQLNLATLAWKAIES